MMGRPKGGHLELVNFLGNKDLIRSALSASVLMTALGIIWVIVGDPYLLSGGQMRLLGLLWVSHLLFWLAYLFIGTPIFVRAVSGNRPNRFESAPGALLTGLAGFAFVIWTTRRYLHRDVDFFSPQTLAVNLVIFALLLGVAALVHFMIRERELLARRLGYLTLVAGLVAVTGLWGATLFALAGGSSESNLPSLIKAEAGSEILGRGIEAAGGRGHRVVILGLDGADWKFIDPLIESGDLPHFKALKEDGAWAPTETISVFSPVDWTSIATGMEPEHHSVQYFSEMYSPALNLTINRLNHNFLQPIYSFVFDKIPVSSTTRTSKAIWEVAGAFGLESLVINWWASFPAAPHRGLLISNYAIPWDEISADRLEEFGTGQGKVYPPERWPAIASVISGALENDTRALSWQGSNPDEKITRVPFWNLRDRMVVDLYREFSSRDHTLTAIYLQGIDTTCHHMSETLFGRNADIPREPRVGSGIIAEKQAMVNAAYRRADTLMGEIMDELQEGDLLAVVSDHGWEFDGTSHWSMPDGIMALYGSAVVKGHAAGRRHIYDLAPTLLYYLGLPISRELPGRALESAFLPEIRAAMLPVTVESYGPRDRPLRLGEARIDPEYRRRLKSLGYVW